MCAANVRAKADSLALSTASSIPRVRTYHTKKPSRFVHALSARPLKNGWRGRESNMCADGIEHIFFAFSVGYAWTLSCRGRRLDDPHGRGEHCSPAKILKETFSFIVLFRDEKYQKSYKRAFLPLKNLLPRARVSRKK